MALLSEFQAVRIRLVVSKAIEFNWSAESVQLMLQQEGIVLTVADVQVSIDHHNDIQF